MPLTYDTYATPRADLGEAFHEYAPEGFSFVADQILPTYNVGKEDGTISVITRENFRTAEADRANGGTFQRIDITAEDLAYACQNYGLEIPITDRDRRKFVDDFQVELEKTAVLRLTMQMQREIRVAALIFNTTTWTGADLYTDVTTDWDDASSTIITDVTTAMEKVRSNSGIRANALIVGEATALNMTKNTNIIARFPDTAMVTVPLIRQNMVTIFGLSKLIVGDAAYNSSDEGQTASMSDVWADDYAMVARVADGPGSPLTTACIGRTLRWQDMDQNVDGVPEMYRESQTTSDILRMQDYLVDKVFDKYFGHLLKVDS